MSTSRWRKVLVRTLIVAGVLVGAFGGLCIIEAMRCPRIARSGYIRHPMLLVEATLGRMFATGGVPRSEVLKDARFHHGDAPLSVSLLYLSDEPISDKPDKRMDKKSIRDRVFGLIMQQQAQTTEQFFWVVRKSGGTMDDGLVYEYSTGKLVCWEH